MHSKHQNLTFIKIYMLLIDTKIDETKIVDEIRVKYLFKERFQQKKFFFTKHR